MATKTNRARAYFHYEDLEEYHAGMWRRLNGDKRKEAVSRAAALMKNAGQFQASMRRAIVEWPRSCMAAFTAEGVNQIAWLGHAGNCLGADSPEECTRVAWHTLSAVEQDVANSVAADVLSEWFDRNAEGNADGQGDLFC